ncbi:NAD-dependent glycerol-3-phosphate dehydrogenase family protein [Ehrlichia chaffeensis str. Heartland]|uniref:Glycerol-3-phosphate dehydrogenase [NAD(P)+] n=1 Tax=Ehrlichia chaffeensis (strain ATCC CRL-10679 / Arkansas) TaxID=205920 RepID=GPDA_EHRCR|nr:NAD(P)H-dependent glycerol-3-phosphate dehydrogenase [Ehrlichia chaffeensis]Q2GHC3.1 RecName: Full=Glycerol-3-phosphate dehydrogenase [NAD(P)+]; AltName: Full=NAD(P)H-dependent glycerol-3-phosphate dehydrogenase [Ehrlichia chaffeensis str. Arkansas]ABD45196.1 glycerol-3-phosphate dehydrogenase (NAD(P)+) [Ehrlichia chaffeensis str. Arkansas]AHX03455.1 NAD-dependent glycerol-3-phosphate dehydrogenase family protein [Ehrlichia chaffeensis str. Heartland]AHX05825.1 NAD-dependent glycerol-3-phosp
MKTTILGAGSFGTAIAFALSSNSTSVNLWGRNHTDMQSIAINRKNLKYLPTCKLPENIIVSSNIDEVLSDYSTCIILAVPTQQLRTLCLSIQDKQHIFEKTPLLICSKGIENISLKFPSEIVKEILPNNPAFILSGPSFAKEIAEDLPCTIVLAGENESLGTSIAQKISNKTFKIIYSQDILGVQIGAALKNIIAIACGIVTGKNLGNNAIATVITKGMEEIKTLYAAKNQNINLSTLIGPSCLGDLILTCTTAHSRNMSFGITIGQGADINKMLNNNSKIIEGVSTVKPLISLAKELNIELPICTSIYNLLYKNIPLEKTISDIL